jgi:putative redox protein
MAMDVRVRYLGGKKFEMTARNHHVASDQPLDNDGADSAMTPPELFLSSLGACAAYYAEEYLRARGLPHEELEIRVSAEKGDRPARITSMQVDVLAPGLNQRHRDGVLRAVDACLIKNTLVVPPHIETRVLTSGEGLAEEPSLALAGR